MIEHIIIALIVIFSPLIMFFVLGINVVALSIIDLFFKDKIEENILSCCSIDPFDHPAFVWGKDGIGYICGYKTNKRNDNSH